MIGIEDVFEARIASAGSVASARRKSSSLTAASSTTASIIRSAATRSSAGSTRPSTSSGSAPPFSASLREALAHRLEPALDRARRGVVERDAAARGGDHLRDPAAHLPRPDDQDVLEPHAAAG